MGRGIACPVNSRTEDSADTVQQKAGKIVRCPAARLKAVISSWRSQPVSLVLQVEDATNQRGWTVESAQGCVIRDINTEQLRWPCGQRFAKEVDKMVDAAQMERQIGRNILPPSPPLAALVLFLFFRLR